jgi:hypothetical protein
LHLQQGAASLQVVLQKAGAAFLKVLVFLNSVVAARLERKYFSVLCA